MRISENSITDLVSRVSPWLAPVPTAYLTYRSVQTHLAFPWYVAAIVGIVVEALGISATNTYLQFHEHNRRLPEKEMRKAPIGGAIVAITFYLITVSVLIVALEANLVNVLFPALSFTGVLIIAMRADHKRRVEEMILSQAKPYHTKRWRMEKKRLLQEMEIDRTGLDIEQKQVEERPEKLGDDQLSVQPSSNGKRSKADFLDAVSRGVLTLDELTDKHLAAYFGVTADKQSSGLTRFEVVTAIRYLHWIGPVYFNLIRPFHHLVVSQMMRAGAASK